MNPLGDKLGVLFLQVMRAHRALAERRLAAIGLHTGQEMILLYLAEHDKLRQNELASALNVEPPTMTKMLQRMERAGVIERRKDEEDARAICVCLTDHGRGLIQPILEVWDEIEAQFTDGLTDAEMLLLRRLLVQMYRNITRDES